MKSSSKLTLFIGALVCAACIASCSKSSPSSATGTSGTSCTVSFQLNYTNKPAANKAVAIFQLVDDTVKTAKEYRLGGATTDAAGKATLQFTCPAKGTYVVVEELKDEVVMGLRSSDGKFLSFECGGDKQKCEAGNLNAMLFGR
ncbi:MAG TPA: hypothetical protein VJT71_00875 [Pyrinomonadaceae bacterium]|nr:hypothetical protein [Pyrinomonadaceae bacterium]